MMLTFWFLLLILNLARFSQAHDNSTLMSYVCDDELLKIALQKLQLLETGNENLRLQMENMIIFMNRKFQELETGTTSTGDEVTANAGDFDFEPSTEAPQKLPSPSRSSSHIPSNCADAVRLSGRINGIHKIRIHGSHLKPFYVYCVVDASGGGGAWTLVQRRLDGSIDFQKPWSDYVRGFGNLEGEFFIGLEKLHELTQSSLHQLWIQMEDFENNTRWAKYSSFAIGDVSESFALSVLGSYTGDAGDSLTVPHAGQKFSTKDVDNDATEVNCAAKYTGAWWYNKCHKSNLNGQYLRGAYAKDLYAKGIVWQDWKDYYYSLKYVHMAIRA